MIAIRSDAVVLVPQIAELFIGGEHSGNPLEIGIDLLDVQPGGLPVKFEVVSSVGAQFDHDFSLDVLVVGDSQVQASAVASVCEGLVHGNDFVGSDVKGITSGESDVLIFWSVVDAVLTNELQRSVALICLKYSHNPLRHRNAQTVGLYILKLHLVCSLDVVLRRSSRTNGDEVEFPDIDVVNLRDELDLFLGVIVQRNGLAQGVHVVI